MARTWNVDVPKATKEQRTLALRLQQKPLPKKIRTIAGADVSTTRFSDEMYAAVVVLSYPDLKLIETVCVKGKATFPYVPGYLSFRELPLLQEAFKRLRSKPDVVMADGQGIAHPRRMGLAAHLGLVTRIPTFGCAKSKLFGEHRDLAEKEGNTVVLSDPKSRETIGVVLRAKSGCKPLYISVGHKITLKEALALTKATLRGRRIPLPTRLAHETVNHYRKESLGDGTIAR